MGNHKTCKGIHIYIHKRMKYIWNMYVYKKYEIYVR